MELLFGFVVFCIPGIRLFFVLFSNVFQKLIEFSRGGITFLFGELGAVNSPYGLIFACQILPLIVIFACIMGLLYYFGIMQFIIKVFAIFFSKVMKTSGAETLCASANIFVGIESALTVRPFLSKMTESELFIVLTVGMSTIGSSVLAIYASFLHKNFPLIAGHLLSASVISIPTAFVICKLMMPEIETPETLTRVFHQSGVFWWKDRKFSQPYLTA